MATQAELYQGTPIPISGFLFDDAAHTIPVDLTNATIETVLISYTSQKSVYRNTTPTIIDNSYSLEIDTTHIPSGDYTLQTSITIDNEVTAQVEKIIKIKDKK